MLLRRSRLTTWLWVLVALLIAGYLALTLWLAFSSIFFPYQLDYGEGIVLWFTRQLAHGEPIYRMPQGPPYVAANYPPIAMLLGTLLYPLFGDSYVWGRWLSFAAALVVTAFIFRWVRDAAPARTNTRSPFAALIAAPLFLGSTFIYHWVALLRVDMLGLAFTAAGVFWAWRWEKEGRLPVARRNTGDRRSRFSFLGSPLSALRFLLSALRSSLFLAFIFFLLALFTKHTLLFAPTAAVVAVALRDRRAAIRLAMALAGAGGAIFGAMELLTHGGWSYGLIASNATVWSPPIFLKLIASFVLTYGVLLALGGWAWWQRVRARQAGVLETYAVAALLGTALAGREGAWENYFFEAVMMGCVFAGFAISRWLESFPLRAWVLPVLLLVQLALFWNEHDPGIALNLLQQTVVGNKEVAPLVRAAQGTVVSEDMGLLVTNGKPVEYYTFPYSTLARAGRWDQHWELEKLRAGTFPLVVLMQGTRQDVDRFGNFTRAFVSALDYGYAPIREDARYAVYAPAPLEHLAPGATFGDELEIVGWSLEPGELHSGEPLTLTIVWRALKPPLTRYTAFAHLQDASGGNLAQDDHEPDQGKYPTTRWAAGEMVRETYALRVPSTLQPGDYFLRVGWYDSLTQENLTMADSSESVELRKWAEP